MTSRSCDLVPSDGKTRAARILLAVALLLLIPGVSAQQEAQFTLRGGWIEVAAITMIIAFVLLSIIFMFSRLLGIHTMEAWVRDEIGNVIFSAVIVLLFVTFAGVIESAANSMASDMLASTQADGKVRYWTYNGASGRWGEETEFKSCPSPCQFYLARGFLGATYEQYGKMVRSNAESLAGSLTMESAAVGTSVTIQLWSFWKLNIAFGLPLYAGRAIFNNTLSVVVEEMLKITTALKAQEIALAYAAGLASVFFIIGIITRILWFLRKFGGLLVALSIGLYVILPLVYVLGWYTIDRSTVALGEDLVLLNGVPQCSGDDESTCTGTSISDLGDIGGVSDETVRSLFTQFDDNNKVKSIGLLDALGRAYLPAIIIPMLAIFVTIGFVRHFSPMLGGDTEIAGLTRII